MKYRFSLYWQTLAMLFLYFATLIVLAFFLFNAQFGLGWEAAVQSPLGERFETIAGALSSQLHASKPSNWNETLKSFAEIYHAQFYVFDIRQEQLAGDAVALPTSVLDRLGPRPRPPMPDGFPRGAGFGSGPHFGPGPDSHFGPGPDSHFGPGPDSHFGPGPDSHFGPGPDSHFGPGPGPEPGKNNDQRFHPPFGVEPPPSVFLHATGRFIVHTQKPDRYWLCARIFVVSPAIGRAVPGLLVAACDNLLQTSLILDFQFVAILIAGMLAFSLLFWYPFIFRITRALSKLTQATESIALGKFDTRINAGGGDEIGRLSGAVDTMAERLQGYVLAQRRLLADISHELFSPLARLQLALELLESNSNEEQTQHIADIREEVQEMNNLVSELIAYSKAGMQAKTPDPGAINLLALFDALLPKLTDLNNVIVDVPADLTVMADRLLLERAISNVVRNSVRYAGDKGPINIKAIELAGRVLLTISDNGPGVSEEALKHLGEPFYRPDSSRNRSMGGFGLGLAIVKSCIEACQGTLLVRNKIPNGLEVQISLKTE